MTNIFEIFNPNDRHWREQKDFDKVHVYTTKKGGRGPMQVDLDDKTIVLPNHAKADPESDQPIKRGSKRPAQAGPEESSDEASSSDEEGTEDKPTRRARPTKKKTAEDQ